MPIHSGRGEPVRSSAAVLGASEATVAVVCAVSAANVLDVTLVDVVAVVDVVAAVGEVTVVAASTVGGAATVGFELVHAPSTSPIASAVTATDLTSIDGSEAVRRGAVALDLWS